MHLSLKSLPIVILTFLALNATASRYFAFGEYESDFHGNPLYIQSLDQGNSWEYKVFPNPNGRISRTEDADCNNSLCVIIGFPDEGYVSTILQSLDRGNTWKKVNLDSIAKDVRFTKVVCEGEVCLLEGTDTQNHDKLFARTADNGKTWSRIDLNAQFPNMGIYLHGCSGHYCFAQGYQNESSSIIHSFDAGATWSEVYANSSLDIHIRDIDCDVNANICFAVGSYLSNQEFKPIIFQSNRAKTVWEEVSLSYPQDTNQFLNIDCSANGCVMIGHNVFDSILAQFKKDGSWEVKSFLNVALNQVDCNNSYCIILGDVYKGHGGYPVILSNAKGKWIDESVPEKMKKSGGLYGLHCEDTLCFAAGYNGRNPAILQRTEGSKWKIQNISGLPDFNYGRLFYGVTVK